MTKLPGKPFGGIYQYLPFDVKARLLGSLRQGSACLFRNQLSGIGKIYGESSVVKNPTISEQIQHPRAPVDSKISVLVKEFDGSTSMRKHSEAPFSIPDKGSSEGASPDVGRIVSMQFFWDSHTHQDVHRGPFRSRTGSQPACYSTKTTAIRLWTNIRLVTLIATMKPKWKTL